MSLKTIQKLATAAAASLLLISCGNEEPTSDPRKPGERPSSATSPGGTQRNDIVETIDPDGKGMHLTATNPEGKKFQASIGDEIEIPDEFPEDVPIFPGSTPYAFLVAPDEGIMVVFKSGEAQQDIFDFYQSSLTDAGWEIPEDPMSASQFQVIAFKGNRRVTVGLSGTRGAAYIRVTSEVTPEDGPG